MTASTPRPAPLAPSRRPHRRLPPAAALMLLAWLPLSAAAGDLVVIVNPQSGIQALSKTEVIHLFMGRQKRLASGSPALTVDLGGDQHTKASFYAKLVNKDLTEINSYWARLIFSGQGSPPLQADSTASVLEIVETNAGAVGYIDETQITPSVRAVFTLPSTTDVD